MIKNISHLGVACSLVLLASCSTTTSYNKPGGDEAGTGRSASDIIQEGRYEQKHDSGPAQQVDMLAAPEVTPVREPVGIAGNKSPYTVNGVKYRVLGGAKGYSERGHASWYGTKFHGHNTANGEVYNMYAMSAAHKTLPLPSYAKVTNLENGRSVIVRVNDRGPFVPGRIIDLSYTAAQKLGYINKGVARVEVTALDPETLPKAGATLAVVKDSAAREALPQDASFKLPANTFLQVGAYGSSDQADKVRRQLNDAFDYPVSVSPINSGGKTLYRVRIGPIAQQRALVALRESVEKRQLGQPQVVVD